MKAVLSRSFREDKVIRALYTGGKLCVASRDQTRLFGWCNGDVAVTDLKTGAVVLEIGAGDNDTFTSFAVDPKGRVLVTSAQSLLMSAWSLEDGKQLRSWKGHSLPVLDMDFDPSGTLVATGSTDRSVRVWDASSGHCTHVFGGHAGVVMRVRFRPRASAPGQARAGRLELVSCAEGGEIRVADLYSRRVRSFEEHLSTAAGVAFSADGRTVYTAGRDRVVNSWDSRPDGSVALRSTVPVYDGLEGIVALPPTALFPGVDTSKAYVATGGSRGEITIRRADTMRSAYTISLRGSDDKTSIGDEAKGAEGAGAAYIRHLILAENYGPGGSLIAATADHNICIFDLRALDRKPRLIIGHNDEVLDVVCLPGEPARVAVATNSPLIRVYRVGSLDAALLSGHSDTVLSLSVVPNGTLLLSASKDTTVRAWSLAGAPAAPRCVAIYSGHTNAVGSVAACRLLRSAYFVTTARDTTIKVWSLEAALDVATGGAPARVASSETAAVAHEKDMNALDISADDKIIATGSADRTVRLWSAPSLTPIATLRGHRRGVWCVRFSPVDRVICSAAGDATIKIWSVSDDYSCLRTFQGHEAAVTSVRFLNAGTQLLSTGAAGDLKLWTIKTNECVGTFAGVHEDKIWGLDVEAKQAFAVTGGADSRVVIWTDNTEAEAEAARREQQDTIQREHKLKQLLRQKEWAQAIRAALSLSHSRQLFRILTHLHRHASNLGEAREAFESCSVEERNRVFCWLREWTTHTGRTPVAARVLELFIRIANPFDAPPDARQEARGVARNLIQYSERHLRRLDRLLQGTYLLDHLAASAAVRSAEQSKIMPGLPPEVESGSSADEFEADSEDDDEDENGDENGEEGQESTQRGVSDRGEDSRTTEGGAAGVAAVEEGAVDSSSIAFEGGLESNWDDAADDAAEQEPAEASGDDEADAPSAPVKATRGRKRKKPVARRRSTRKRKAKS